MHVNDMSYLLEVTMKKTETNIHLLSTENHELEFMISVMIPLWTLIRE